MGTGAYIKGVEEGSPADDAGFSPGCRITHVNGHRLRDVIDWQWLSSDCEMEVGYIDGDGEAGTVVLERAVGERWGFELKGAVFDGVRTCRNACTFCFMRQLPPGMRKTLSLRDDDFRLSFLTGTFVTLTNLDDTDVERIAEQRISPLRVSLHAVSPEVRRRLIGRSAERGLVNLKRLLGAGIAFDAQVVLVPGVNDGKELDRTLEWAYGQRGINAVGIVPLGFTAHQATFDRSFDDPRDARRVLDQIRPYQERARRERGGLWVYAADEFYRNAYGERVLEMLPSAEEYGDFEMFEDGIGIIRSCVDDFVTAVASGVAEETAQALTEADACVRYLCGEAMQPYFGQMIAASPLEGRLRPLAVKNAFFGGNVNVTGLLCGVDIVRAISQDAASEASSSEPRSFYAIPDVVLNADGYTLDGLTLVDLRSRLDPLIAPRVHIVPTNPIDYMHRIARIVETESQTQRETQHGHADSSHSRTPECGQVDPRQPHSPDQ